MEADNVNSDEEITTSVDQLLELLKSQDTIPLSEAAQQLGVGLDVVQSWVDFLVEEQIVGIEYKFTKPFIYLNKPELKQEKAQEESSSIDSIKENFVKKAQTKNIPNQNISFLWKNHAVQALELKRDFFFEQADRRGLQDIPGLWVRYKKKFEGG